MRPSGDAGYSARGRPSRPAAEALLRAMFPLRASRSRRARSARGEPATRVPGRRPWSPPTPPRRRRLPIVTPLRTRARHDRRDRRSRSGGEVPGGRAIARSSTAGARPAQHRLPVLGPRRSAARRGGRPEDATGPARADVQRSAAEDRAAHAASPGGAVRRIAAGFASSEAPGVGRAFSLKILPDSFGIDELQAASTASKRITLPSSTSRTRPSASSRSMWPITSERVRKAWVTAMLPHIDWASS